MAHSNWRCTASAADVSAADSPSESFRKLHEAMTTSVVGTVLHCTVPSVGLPLAEVSSNLHTLAFLVKGSIVQPLALVLLQMAGVTEQ